jgi:hypothetical protein
MPGFRPNKYYLREMKRFGILPPDLAPDDPVDPYATDRRYWQSFWYQPVAEARGPTGRPTSAGEVPVAHRAKGGSRDAR